MKDHPTTPDVEQRGPRAVRIVSGGQTGVDQGALDAARQLGLPHGGWCPRGRRSEAGPIPMIYPLRESHSPIYAVRTAQNVVESDGTLILFRGAVEGGTALTRDLARRHRKPYLLIDLATWPLLGALLVDEVRSWLEAEVIQTLNVAGPRESHCPGIQPQVAEFVRQVFRE